MQDKEQIAWACRKIILSALNVLILNARFLTVNNYATQNEKYTLNRLADYLDGFQARLYRGKDKAQAAAQQVQIEASAEFTGDVLLISECVHSKGRDEFLKAIEALQEQINAKYIEH